MNITVFAPASIGNFSVGYDLLGAAIAPVDGSLLGDLVEIKTSNSYEVVAAGPFANQLPSHPSDNIVHHCHELFVQQLQHKNIEQQPVRLTLTKNLPVGSGLGSSSSSIVAAFVALNEWCGKPFTQQELLLMMGRMEAQISGSLHYDNIAPCYLGGLQLMTSDQSISQPLPWFEDWYVVIANPGTNILTKEAREAIPKAIKLTRATQYAQNLAGFIQSLYSNNKASAVHHLKDVIAEPYRHELLPNFQQHKAKLLELGASAMGISGSGPTLFAICETAQKAEVVNQYLEQEYHQNERAFNYICRINNQGARCISEEIACHS